MAVSQEPELLGWSDAVVDVTAGASGGRVMVVDDEPSNVTFVSRILRDAGRHRVSGFTDAHTALSVVRDWNPDLVVLDLHMQGLDGVAFLAALHSAAAPDDFLPVLVLTADDTNSSMRSALAAGANDYATKPLDPDELLLRVRNLLNVRFCHENLKTHNAELAGEIRARTRLDREHDADDRLTFDRITEELRTGGPEMVFQPIVDLRGDATVGYEALARFTRSLPPRRPDVWFSEAASVGLGSELEVCAVETALEQVGHMCPGQFVAVNLSPATLMSEECHDLMAGAPIDRIVLEITEHQPIDDYCALIATINHLRERGARLAIDDAGAGFASLRHILKLSPDFIKLDIGLTGDIDTDPIKRALVPALVGFAAETGALIIAEGVETAAELATLRRLGVDYGQGFHIARPQALPQTRPRPALVDPDLPR